MVSFVAPRQSSRRWLIRMRNSFISKVRRKRKNTSSSHDLSGSTALDQQGLIIKDLYDQCYQLNWFDLSPDDYALADGGASNLGVLLKSSKTSPESGTVYDYIVEPLGTSQQITLTAARLDLVAAFTTSSDMTRALLERLVPDQTELSVEGWNFVLPIFDSLAQVGEPGGDLEARSTAARAVGVCLCRNERVALIWSDHPKRLIAHGKDIEAKFMALINATSPPSAPSAPTTLHETPQPSRSTSKRHSRRISWFSKAPSQTQPSDEGEKLHIGEPSGHLTLEPDRGDAESYDSEREFRRRYRRSWLPTQGHRRSWSASEHLGT